MVDESIDQRCGGRSIGENVCPIAEGKVGGQDETAALVALADDLEEQIGGAGIVGEVADFVDDQQTAGGIVAESVREAAGGLPGCRGRVGAGWQW